MIRIVVLSLLILPLTSQAEDGQAMFNLHCSVCHGKEADGKSTLPTARNLWKDSFVTHPETEAGVITMINVGNPEKGMAPLAHLPEGTKKAIASYVIAYRKANGLAVKAEAEPEQEPAAEAASSEGGEAEQAKAEADAAPEAPASPTEAEAAPKPKVMTIEAAIAAELQETKDGPLNVYTGIGLVDGLNVFGLPVVSAPVPELSPEAMPEGDEAEASEDADGDE